MRGTKELINSASGIFEDFVIANNTLLQQAAIPDIHHKKIFTILKEYGHSSIFQTIEPEALLQLLTGECQFLDMHVDKIGIHNNLILFCGGMNGHPDVLEWFLKHQIIQPADQPDDESYGSESAMNPEDKLISYLLESRNIQGLVWAADKNMIRTTQQTAFIFIDRDWLDGFIWFNNRFPKVMFGQYTIQPWYAEKIFEILKKNPGYEYNELSFGWLTGDLSLYDLAFYHDRDKDMVWCGIMSGNMDVIDWLVKHKMIRLQADHNGDHFNSRAPYLQEGNAQKFRKAISCSGNIAVLAWAYQDELVIDWFQVFAEVLLVGWLEGFIWILEKFPSFLFREFDGDFMIGKCRSVHILASAKSPIPLLEWYRKNKPAQLYMRDGLGHTLLHLAAAHQNIPVLRWCLEYFPVLAECNDNQSDESIVHIGAALGNEEIVRMGLSCDKSLVSFEDKRGMTMTMHALCSGDADFFNKILSFTENPSILDNICPTLELCHNPLNVLNKALDTNYSLRAISVDKEYYVSNKAVCKEIKNKLFRNSAYKILMLPFKGMKDEQSAFFMLSQDIFRELYKALIDLYTYSGIASMQSPQRFFNRNVAKDMIEQNEVFTVFETRIS